MFEKLNNLRMKNKLFEAIHERDVKKVEELLKKGVNPDSLDELRETALARTISENVIGAYKRENIYDVYVDVIPTSLTFEQKQIMSLLLEYGADPNFMISRSLEVCYSKSNKIKAKREFYNEEAQKKYRGTFLNTLIEIGDEDMILKALEHGADINYGKGVESVINLLNKGVYSERLIKKILEKVDVINEIDALGDTLLH